MRKVLLLILPREGRIIVVFVNPHAETLETMKLVVHAQGREISGAVGHRQRSVIEAVEFRGRDSQVNI